MPDLEKIKVLLVDDHPFVLEGVRSFLLGREGFDVVGEAANGQEAYEKCQALRPSVVVMDISMPVLNGIEATRFLRERCPDAKVLVFTMHEKREFASQIVAAGARGYLSKHSDPPELLRAIQALHRGETFFPPWFNDAFVQDYARRGSQRLGPGGEVTLREREVLRLIAQGYSNKEAASLLRLSIRTVEKHRERAMEKLNLKSAVELTKYAIAHGIIELEGGTGETPALPDE